MDNKPFDSLKKNFNENRLSHAFLIETNNIELCYSDLKEFIKEINCSKKFISNCSEECNICHLIDNNNLPSLITIWPDGANIKKEQLYEVMDRFKFSPIYTKRNIYVVCDAEKMNDSASNTILKFLEEPEDDILGFFIVTNSENIISTIKSRCQIIKCVYENLNIKQKLDLSDDEYLELTDFIKEYLKTIFLSKEENLIYNSVAFDKYLNKETEGTSYNESRRKLEKLFQIMLEIFNNQIFCYYDNEYDKDLFEEFEKYFKDRNIKKIVEISKVIAFLLNNLNGNSNLRLLLDRFAIEIGGKNE